MQEPELENVSESNPMAPTHFVFFIHGVGGSASDFLHMSNKLATHPQVHTHLAKANAGLFCTIDGVKKGGERLLTELKQELSTLPTIQYLSLVGHSFGGIYARYVAGRLESEDLLSRYIPMNFITLATPHLGIRRPQNRWLNPFLMWLSAIFARKTGLDLLLEDEPLPEIVEGLSEDGTLQLSALKVQAPEGHDVPVLLELALSPYIDGLKRFRHHTTYSNIFHDPQVPYCTGAMCTKNPYREHTDYQPENPERRHIIKSSGPHATQPQELLQRCQSANHFSSSGRRGTIISVIHSALNQIPWRTVDVLFHAPAAHERIIQKYSFHGAEDVVLDLYDHFVVS
eukprot:GFYU01017357.1.p1 GENE.GFYU01017357.1~~GFYU01017357.1.p1  ORF type:complete len:342 (-),score=27.57 GFYU01017357.1:56-1081(-)